MPSTPVMGNGRQRHPASQEGGRRFAWLSEKRLVSALSGKQDYEVQDVANFQNEMVLEQNSKCMSWNTAVPRMKAERLLVHDRSCGWS